MKRQEEDKIAAGQYIVGILFQKGREVGGKEMIDPHITLEFKISDTEALDKVINLLYKEAISGDAERITTLAKAIKDLAIAKAVLLKMKS